MTVEFGSAFFWCCTGIGVIFVTSSVPINALKGRWFAQNPFNSTRK